jgi:hypothetical protein
VNERKKMKKSLKNFIRSIINKLNLSDKNQNEDDDYRDDLNTDDSVDELRLSNSEKKEEAKLKVIL